VAQIIRFAAAVRVISSLNNDVLMKQAAFLSTPVVVVQLAIGVIARTPLSGSVEPYQDAYMLLTR
jgi:hypothetical protein